MHPPVLGAIDTPDVTTLVQDLLHLAVVTAVPDLETDRGKGLLHQGAGVPPVACLGPGLHPTLAHGLAALRE